MVQSICAPERRTRSAQRGISSRTKFANSAGVLAVEQAMARAGQGLEGDRWNCRPTGARQVSLIAAD